MNEHWQVLRCLCTSMWDIQPKLLVWYICIMNEHWQVLRCLYTSIWAQVRNLWYNILGPWMSTEKCSDARVQAFGHASATDSMTSCDHAWALKSVQMLVYKHFGANPKLLVQYNKHVGTNPKLIVCYIGTMNEHWNVFRCLYTSIWAQVRNF